MQVSAYSARWRRVIRNSNAHHHKYGLSPQICHKHSLQLYTCWSLFQSDVGELVHLLHVGLHSHLDSHDGDDVSAQFPPLISGVDEARLPLPPEAAQQYISEGNFEDRLQAEKQVQLQWRQQCPASAAQVMAAITVVLETVRTRQTDEQTWSQRTQKLTFLFRMLHQQRLRVESSWSDEFGVQHVSPAPENPTNGAAESIAGANTTNGSYSSFAELMAGKF
jgi:hypothetical protein